MFARLEWGIVSDNTEPGFARVKFEEHDMVSAPLQVLSFKAYKDKFSNPPDINAQVACLMDENLEYGIVLGELSNKQDKPDPGEAVGKDRKKYSDGTVIEYDRTTHTYTIDAKGPVIIKAAPVVNITGNVIITGTLTAAAIATSGVGGTISAPGGSISAADVTASNDVMGGGKSLKLHVHAGVTSGNSSTLPPT